MYSKIFSITQRSGFRHSSCDMMVLNIALSSINDNCHLKFIPANV